jgi:hypothetical protein
VSIQLERVLAEYASVQATLGRSDRARSDFPEDAFLANLQAMQARQAMRFRSILGTVAAIFALVFAFSLTNHFSLEIAKLAIGSGGLLAVVSTLLLRGVWRDYTLIDLILTTLPIIAPQERKGFVLSVLASLRETRTRSEGTRAKPARAVAADS